MSIVSNNIKYLRRLNGLTQEQFARKIAIKRSLLGAYEEARANPNLTNLKNMASAFGVSVDNLLKNDLRKLRETPELSLPLAKPMTVSHSGSATPPAPKLAAFTEPQPLSAIMEKYQQPEQPIRMVSRQVNLKPVSGEAPAGPPVRQQSASNYAAPQPAPQANQFPVFNNQIETGQFNARMEDRQTAYPTIQWVSQNLHIDYLNNYQNPAYLTNLPSFQLPNLPAGYYRGFESGADFQYPGALLVGTFVRNWYDIKDGLQYVFALRSYGIVSRIAFNEVKSTGLLVLTSPHTEDIEVPLHEVLEVWEVKAFISLQMPTPQPSLERVSQLVDKLQMELSQYKQ